MLSDKATVLLCYAGVDCIDLRCSVLFAVYLWCSLPRLFSRSSRSPLGIGMVPKIPHSGGLFPDVSLQNFNKSVLNMGSCHSSVGMPCSPGANFHALWRALINCKMLKECHDNAFPAFHHTCCTVSLHCGYSLRLCTNYNLTCCIYFIHMANTSLESFSRW